MLSFVQKSSLKKTAAALSTASALFSTQTTALSNGFRVASEKTSAEDTATVGVWIDAGSRFESADKTGIAHFLEHMHFKGTGSRSQAQLEAEIENKGAHLNAYTTREHTVYFAKVFKRDVPWAVELLGDILRNSKYDAGAVEAEKDTILTEMRTADQGPDNVVFDRLHGSAYDGSGLANRIIGTAESVRNMSRDDLVQFVENHYTAPRMVLSAAGAVDHDELVGLAETHFGSMPAGEGALVDLSGLDTAVYTGSAVHSHVDEMPKVHFAVGCEGVGAAHPDFYTLAVMKEILGFYDSNQPGAALSAARLSQRAAPQPEIADSLTAFSSNYRDSGLFGVSGVCDPKELEDAIWLAQNEMVRLAFSVTEEEVSRAKHAVKTNMLLALDGTTAVAEDIGRSLLTNRRRATPQEISAAVDAVSVSSVKAAANEYIYDREPVLSAVGNLKYVPDYNWVRGWTYWLRA